MSDTGFHCMTSFDWSLTTTNLFYAIAVRLDLVDCLREL